MKSTTIYLPVELRTYLRTLSERTRIPQAVLLRSFIQAGMHAAAKAPDLAEFIRSTEQTLPEIP